MWAMSDRGVELMARKYVKSFIFYDEHETDIDTFINTWLDSKHEEVGKTIARFDVLDIKLAISHRGTTRTSFAMVIYTEMRL